VFLLLFPVVAFGELEFILTFQDLFFSPRHTHILDFCFIII